MKCLSFRKWVATVSLLSSFTFSWAYELVIPEGTEVLDWSYLEEVENAEQVTSVVVPSSVKFLSCEKLSGAFRNLEKIVLDFSLSELLNQDGENNYNNDCRFSDNRIFLDGKDVREITSIEIPKGYETIPHGLKGLFPNLTSLTIPSGVNVDLDHLVGIDTIKFDFTLKEYLGRYSQLSPYHLLDNCESIILDGKDTKEITSLEIPDGVTELNSNEIGLFPNLTSITIPQSVTTLDEWAFIDCFKLSSLIFADGVTEITADMVQPCKHPDNTIVNIYIPSSVTKIEENAFYDKTGPTKSVYLDFELSDWFSADRFYLTALDGMDLVFADGTAISQITSVTIPEGVTNISTNVFSLSLFPNLTSVILPQSVTSIEEEAFAGCDKLTGLYYRLGGSDILLEETDLTKITSLSLPYGMTTIPEYAFTSFSNLTTVTLPSSVTTIEENAFANCPNLKTVVLDFTIDNWLARERSYNNALEDMTILLDGIAVTDITSLEFKVAGSMNNNPILCNSDFSIFPNLTSISVPSGVKKITADMFSSLVNITTVSLPSSVTSIEENAFANCLNLDTFKLDCSLEEWFGSKISYKDRLEGRKVILNGEDYSTLESLVIPREASYVDESCMTLFSRLTSIVIPDRTNIIAGAFLKCFSLDTISLYYSMEEWFYNRDFDAANELKFDEMGHERTIMFNGTNVKEITSLVIPWGPKDLNKNQLSLFPHLTSLTLSSSITDISSDAFSACPDLKTIVFDFTVDEWFGDNRNYHCDWNGMTIILDGKDTKEITSLEINDCYDLSKGRLSIFPTINSVTLSGTSVGWEGPFMGRTDISSVTIKGSTRIEQPGFEDCTGLTSVTIEGNGYVTIGAGAFRNCTGLTTININSGEYIKYIDIQKYALGDVPNLKSIVCRSNTVPKVDEFAFISINDYQFHGDATLYVPCASKEDYEKDEVWGRFKFIECLESEQIQEELADVTVDPDVESAGIVWPSTEDAASYVLDLSQNGEFVARYEFDENGRMTSVGSTSMRSLSAGFLFRITGLDEDTEYTYRFEAKDKLGNSMENYTGKFRTLKNVTSVDEIMNLDNQVVVIGDLIQVEKCGKSNVSIFNAQGQCLYSHDGAASFQVPNEGVYLVRCDNRTVKVLVK